MDVDLDAALPSCECVVTCSCEAIEDALSRDRKLAAERLARFSESVDDFLRFPTIGDTVNVYIALETVDGKVLQRQSRDECYGYFAGLKPCFEPKMCESLVTELMTLQYGEFKRYDCRTGKLLPTDVHTLKVMVLGIERFVQYSAEECPDNVIASSSDGDFVASSSSAHCNASFKLAGITKRGMAQPRSKQKHRKEKG